ncbi:hypothetical protein ACU686_22325 [Yinghuangia aomiensis]
MSQDLVLHDWVVAAIAMAAGARGRVAAACVLMRWLGGHASGTAWSRDDTPRRLSCFARTAAVGRRHPGARPRRRRPRRSRTRDRGAR